MRGYAELEIFTGEELETWRCATKLVDALHEAEFPDVRCHELARAVGKVLGLQVQDGFYGFVDHSWLWLRPLGPTVGRFGFPNILDVYSVGVLPLVRLVDAQATSLPHVGWAYRPANAREDVKLDTVDRLVARMAEVALERA
jgi:hypothetical protein